MTCSAERGVMILIKALAAANRSERDKFSIPRSVQQSIPVKRIYGDGIWQVGRKHSRTWRFSDVNYAAASEDDQRGIFLSSTACPPTPPRKSPSSTAASTPWTLNAPF